MRNSAVPGRIVIILLCLPLAAAALSLFFKPLLQIGFMLDGLIVLSHADRPGCKSRLQERAIGGTRHSRIHENKY